MRSKLQCERLREALRSRSKVSSVLEVRPGGTVQRDTGAPLGGVRSAISSARCLCLGATVDWRVSQHELNPLHNVGAATLPS